MPTTRKSPSKPKPKVTRKRPIAGELSRLMSKLDRLTAVISKWQSSGLFELAQMKLRQQRHPLPEYAKVVAVGENDEVSEFRGLVGIVLDAASAAGQWSYTVYFPTRREAVVLGDNVLWDTGQTVPEDVIYGGGETRRVRVDARGNGAVIG